MEKKPSLTGEGRKPTKKRIVKPTKSDNGSAPATGASSQASSSAGSSLTNSRVSTPSIAPSTTPSSGSTSAAASCSNSAAALATSESSKPRYQYTRASWTFIVMFSYQLHFLRSVVNLCSCHVKSALLGIKSALVSLYLQY